jgi:hypothetical protein
MHDAGLNFNMSMKVRIKMLLLVLLVAAGIVLNSCFAQKKHGSVPCPCEKNKKH